MICGAGLVSGQGGGGGDDGAVLLCVLLPRSIAGDSAPGNVLGRPRDRPDLASST